MPFLNKDGLRGARIGVFRYYVNKPNTDLEVKALTERAIKDLVAQGAEMVDPFEIPDFRTMLENIWCDTFYGDVNVYLATLGERAPYKTIDDILASGLYSPTIGDRLKRGIEAGENAESCPDLYHRKENIAFRAAILKAMDASRIDAIIYPTWSNPPRRVGDFKTPLGDNSQDISPHTGFPAITVPMGHTRDVLPAGLTFVGRLFSEPGLIRFAYAYEQATKHHRSPALFPPLK